MGRRKRIDRQKVRELYEQGLSDRGIARELDCSVDHITRIRTRELNLYRGPRTETKLSKEDLIQCVEEGLTVAQIAEKYDVSKSYVYTKSSQLGLTNNKDTTPYTQDKARKTLASVINKFRIQFQLTRKEVAEITGISKETITKLITESNESNYGGK